MKIATQLQHKCQCICPMCKIYFLDWKTKAVPSELISQMFTSLHTGSHIKPQSENAHANEGRQKRTIKEQTWVSEEVLFCTLLLQQSFALDKN